MRAAYRKAGWRGGKGRSTCDRHTQPLPPRGRGSASGESRASARRRRPSPSTPCGEGRPCLGQAAEGFGGAAAWQPLAPAPPSCAPACEAAAPARGSWEGRSREVATGSLRDWLVSSGKAQKVGKVTVPRLFKSLSLDCSCGCDPLLPPAVRA